MTKAAYEPVEQIGVISIVRHAVTRRFYASWYEKDRRQVVRVSLKTDRISDACEAVRACIDAGYSEDPKAFLKRARIATVRDLLEWRRPQLASSPSRKVEEINLDIILKSPIADRRLVSLQKRDFEELRDFWINENGIAISTVSRRLSVLRSAGHRAVEESALSAIAMPTVPEFRKQRHKDAAPRKGKLLTCRELASLYDALEEPHLKVFFAFLFGTAARRGALLDLTREQCDLRYGLLDLNPPDRDQTNKRRPELKLIEPLKAWVAPAPPGLLVHWRGEAIKSLKSGLRRARKGADLALEVNTYSARHSAGQYMSNKGIKLKELGFWLGHGRPEEGSESSRQYAKYSPEYLKKPARVMTAFFNEIARYAQTPLLTPPPDVLAYYEVQRDRLQRRVTEARCKAPPQSSNPAPKETSA